MAGGVTVLHKPRDHILFVSIVVDGSRRGIQYGVVVDLVAYTVGPMYRGVGLVGHRQVEIVFIFLKGSRNINRYNTFTRALKRVRYLGVNVDVQLALLIGEHPLLKGKSGPIILPEVAHVIQYDIGVLIASLIVSVLAQLLHVGTSVQLLSE